jgi:MbtH protein
MADTDADSHVYDVVSNSSKQYSIWPADRELPAGWTLEGTTGSKASCLDRISEVWNDLRSAGRP